MATNGNDVTRVFQDAAQAQLSERVTNLGRRQSDLESEMRTGFRQLEQSIASLSANLSERNKPQWTALGVALAFAGMLGGLAYMPIREATNDLKMSVATLATTVVTREEMDWRTARGAEDRTRTETAIADLRGLTVTRNEWSERNRARDQEITDLSRRIEEIRAILGSQYTTRDVLLELQEEIKELRRRARAQNPLN